MLWNTIRFDTTHREDFRELKDRVTDLEALVEMLLDKKEKGEK
jgi:hypothetical protein